VIAILLISSSCSTLLKKKNYEKIPKTTQKENQDVTTDQKIETSFMEKEKKKISVDEAKDYIDQYIKQLIEHPENLAQSIQKIEESDYAKKFVSKLNDDKKIRIVEAIQKFLLELSEKVNFEKLNFQPTPETEKIFKNLVDYFVKLYFKHFPINSTSMEELKDHINSILLELGTVLKGTVQLLEKKKTDKNEDPEVVAVIERELNCCRFLISRLGFKNDLEGKEKKLAKELNKDLLESIIFGVNQRIMLAQGKQKEALENIETEQQEIKEELNPIVENTQNTTQTTSK
jgi:hypothetical protein